MVVLHDRTTAWKYGHTKIKRYSPTLPNRELMSLLSLSIHVAETSINTMFSMHGDIKKYIPINPVAFSVHQDL